MNQSIQFPDRESRDDDRECIVFPVMINGFLSDCRVSAQYLQSRYGTASGEDMLILFRRNRWDLEKKVKRMSRLTGCPVTDNHFST